MKDRLTAGLGHVIALGAVTIFLAACGGRASGQTLTAPYQGSYSLLDLGAVPGLTTPYGGLVLKQGDANTLLIGGSANNGGGVIDSVALTRNAAGHITGFGPATIFASAPNIDGGLAYGPGGVLFYTAYPTNQIGELKPGSTAPDKIVSLPGVASSVGALGFVPSYAPGAGQFKLISYGGGGFYDAALTADGTGTYNIGATTLRSTPGGGPEGFVYVPPTSPVFTGPTMLISDYVLGTIAAYSVDAGGNPIDGSSQTFITGLTGAEGAFIDPITGDFLFSTFGAANHVVEARGFTAPPPVPEPSALVLCSAAAMLGLALARRHSGRLA